MSYADDSSPRVAKQEEGSHSMSSLSQGMVDLEESFTSLESLEDARVGDVGSPLLDKEEDNDVLDVDYEFNQGSSGDVLDEEVGSFSSDFGEVEEVHRQEVVVEEPPCPVAVAAEVVVVAPEPNLCPLDFGILPVKASVCPVALNVASVEVNPCPVAVAPTSAPAEECPVALDAAPVNPLPVAVAPTPAPVAPVEANPCPVAVAPTPAPAAECPVALAVPPIVAALRNPSYVRLDLPPRRPYTSAETTHACNCLMKSVPENMREFLREGTADELSKGTVFFVSHRRDKAILKHSDTTWRLAVFVAKIPKSENIRYRLLARSEFPGYGFPLFFDDFVGRNGRMKTCNSNSKPSTFVIRCVGDRPHFYLLQGPQGTSE